MNSHVRWFAPLRLLVLLPLLVLMSSFIRSTGVSAAGGLTINVVNQNGQPAASATWVDVYDPAGNQQQDAGYLTDGTGTFSRVQPGTYTVVVSSMGDGFQLHTTIPVTTNTVLNLDARVGTIPVTFVGYAKDGTPLNGAAFALAPQPILGVSGFIGSTYPNGQLQAVVTPGVYTIAVQDSQHLLRLDIANETITQVGAFIQVHAADIPTGSVNVALHGASEGAFRVNREPSIPFSLPLTAANTIVASTGTLYGDVELYKKDASSNLWDLDAVPMASPFQITAGSSISVDVGGTLTTTIKTGPRYTPGMMVPLQQAFHDTYNNPINYLVAYGSGPTTVGTVTVIDANAHVLSQQTVDIRDGTITDLTIPLTATLGAATATFNVDTGPFQGTLSAHTTFEIVKGYYAWLPIVVAR
ncbi:MAG: carboxypeptidase regulatory-like domain-containing protein [Herpetosiphonaceae bacterium]|nr:carboxypeptidase regulatory-like domain-containing protein [Herpetosiphonaceae bacterium]